jgi:hypothetical protein
MKKKEIIRRICGRNDRFSACVCHLRKSITLLAAFAMSTNRQFSAHFVHINAGQGCWVLILLAGFRKAESDLCVKTQSFVGKIHVCEPFTDL